MWIFPRFLAAIVKISRSVTKIAIHFYVDGDCSAMVGALWLCNRFYGYNSQFAICSDAERRSPKR